MILTMNNFSFNDNHYLQIHGTAMGIKMAPCYANPFLGFFEANALKNAPFQPYTWLRYIDDIFMVWITLKFPSTILTTFTPPPNSPVHTLLLTYPSLT